MGECELELSDIGHVSAQFSGPRVPEFLRLLPVAFHRVAAVEGGRRDGTPRRAVYQQAGAAEALEFLERRQDRILVELDCAVRLVARNPDPCRPYTRAIARLVVAVQDSYLPLFDLLHIAAEPLRRLAAKLIRLVRRGAHRVFRFIGGSDDAATGLPVHQQRYADVALNVLEFAHQVIADIGNSVVDRRGLRLNCRRACMHSTHPLASGQHPGGAAEQPPASSGRATDSMHVSQRKWIVRRVENMDSDVLDVDTARERIVDLTDPVRKFCADRGDGLLNVFVPHATAGVAIIETGAGSDDDLVDTLERLLPRDDRYRHAHGSPGHGADHVLPALVAPSVTVSVQGGRPPLGTWQSVVLVDLNSDNPQRQVRLSFLDA